MGEKLNSRIRERLKAEGLTQGKLAEKLGIDRSSVSHWLAGRTAPEKHFLPTVALALNTSPDYLLGLTDDPSPRAHAAPTIAVPQLVPPEVAAAIKRVHAEIEAVMGPYVKQIAEFGNAQMLDVQRQLAELRQVMADPPQPTGDPSPRPPQAAGVNSVLPSAEAPPPWAAQLTEGINALLTLAQRQAHHEIEGEHTDGRDQAADGSDGGLDTGAGRQHERQHEGPDGERRGPARGREDAGGVDRTGRGDGHADGADGRAQPTDRGDRGTSPGDVRQHRDPHDQALRTRSREQEAPGRSGSTSPAPGAEAPSGVGAALTRADLDGLANAVLRLTERVDAMGEQLAELRPNSESTRVAGNLYSNADAMQQGVSPKKPARGASKDPDGQTA